ncbi:glutamine synthetase [Thalassotalea sp. HSM 43]|uniref:glutamine synthetase family protein n=1 Tax=Thalassotalea sp. HSM 43 TaxID=2552945 RepID=UPI00108071A8|nr:glutamine synthetase family protein [Thalassotalea sp. HSM 43]QBY03269.1 glutamine synthetase [Thalassotalea sp. HSM 43]
MTTIEAKLKQLRDENIKWIKLAFTDIDGVHRGKYVSIDKFATILSNGAGFCDCVLGWDMDDQLYDNVEFTGWHTGFPDALYKIDLSTERRLPDEHNIPFYLVEFNTKDGGDHPICPRSLLKRVLAKANSMNIDVKLAFEYEFFIFNETPETVREKNYQNLNHYTQGNFGYSLLRANAKADMYHQFLEYCEQMDFALEGLHCETGPGVWEAAIGYDSALNMADKATLFKTFSKSFFQKQDLMATFMAKCSMDYPGQSGHVHQSLYDATTGDSLFYQEGAEHHISDTMRHYIAGQQKYLKPLLAMCAPTINSYTRLIKGFWAPTAATWGVENRTTALRVIGNNAKSQRVEFRLGSADANPYLVAAAVITAGLLGIEQQLTPTNALIGNAYEQEEELADELQLATNLRDAARDFQRCDELTQALGEDFCRHFYATRMWEVREYERQVTDWQMQRYFEII